MYFFHFVLVGAVHDDSKRSQKNYENSCLQIGFFRFNSCKMPGNLWGLKCMKKNDIIEKTRQQIINLNPDICSDINYYAFDNIHIV